ncbi:MAG: hypothetical protein JJ902_23235 [Roseibium sp.]|nr:hypothetical protein [Roseibium sp.]
MTGLMDLIGAGFDVVVAYGGAAGAVLVFLARFHPAVPGWASTAAVIALTAVSSWFFSARHHDRQADIDQLQKDNQRLSAVIQEQARQREAAERLAARMATAARDRMMEADTLRRQVDDYETALAAGTVAACPGDAAYERRMRAIPIHPDVPDAKPAGASGGSDPGVP